MCCLCGRNDSLRQDKIDAALVMGSTKMQIISKVLLPEAMPGLVSALTTTMVTLVGYSAMAGIVGAACDGSAHLWIGGNAPSVRCNQVADVLGVSLQPPRRLLALRGARGVVQPGDVAAAFLQQGLLRRRDCVLAGISGARLAVGHVHAERNRPLDL